jgi:hypothetical protein
VFVPGSRADDVTGHECVEATGADDVLRVVSFAKGETDEGLDVAAPTVVEGELVVIRHPARGQFPAVVETKVREARRSGDLVAIGTVRGARTATIRQAERAATAQRPLRVRAPGGSPQTPR